MRHPIVTLLILCSALLSSAFAQAVFPTSHSDNMRSAANTNETLLTPANVNKGSFGHLWSFPVDYQVLAQPLYVSNVTMPDQSVHNVVYVVTQTDSVYAIDAACALVEAGAAARRLRRRPGAGLSELSPAGRR